jgi:hypothetical protein
MAKVSHYNQNNGKFTHIFRRRTHTLDTQVTTVADLRMMAHAMCRVAVIPTLMHPIVVVSFVG